MLDDRKLKVLRAVIKSYIISAEPIGSKAILKEYDFGVSSATIRNEMSNLEEMGYLNKPHTSAGRIPSDKAYRLYVNEILNENIKKETLDLNFENMNKDRNQLDEILRDSSKILSSITSYTALIISPQQKIENFKHIQVLAIDIKEILIILVTDNNEITNKMYKINKDISQIYLDEISIFLNNNLKGLSLLEVKSVLNNDLINTKKDYEEVFTFIIEMIEDRLQSSKDVDIYTEGVNKIFDYPEYNNIEKAKSLISFIEDRETLLEALIQEKGNMGIRVSIGDENIYDPLKDSTLITTSYKLNDKTIGKIGVLGPTRMDYFEIINLLEMFSKKLSKILENEKNY